MIDSKTKAKRQYPMMSRTERPQIPIRGMVQKGWITFPMVSPDEIAWMARGRLAFRVSAAFTTRGAWISQTLPEVGAKRFRITAWI